MEIQALLKISFTGGRRIFIRNGQALDEAIRASGKFGGKTSDAEKQKKIDSVNINFDRDNTLPGLNKEDLAEFGKEDKPVLFKKGTLDRNLREHPEVEQARLDTQNQRERGEEKERSEMFSFVRDVDNLPKGRGAGQKPACHRAGDGKRFY